MVRLALSFFGPFQVILDSQPVTHFYSANTQGLFIYLVLNSDRPQPREVLATLFWPEETGKNARNNLRQSLFRLRKMLGDVEDSAQLYLPATRQSVQFNPASEYDLDVHRFLKAIETHDLELAVSTYFGELLPGFTCDSLEFEEWLRQERERLHQLAMAAMFEITQDYLQAGRLDKAQEIARRQLNFEPWREQAHRQLMQAYALAGDRGTALAQYEICREQLWAELGLEPTAETVTLYEEIQAGRYAPVAASSSLRPPVKVRHNLPADTIPFIGRELELDQINRLFIREKQRLVTIVGPGGMGKTRLARAVGLALLEQFRDGVYFVDLAPLVQVEEIVPALTAALDYQAPDKSQDIFPQLLKSLGTQQYLLIMDNFEHLLPGAGLVNDILRACPAVSILVTSRQRLNLVSESRYELDGLEYPVLLTPENALSFTAVQLFVDHGKRAQPHFALTSDNIPDVIRICQLVQGMPLGLVLAAAWLEMLTPAEIAEEVENCLYFLAAELVDLPPRQRDLHAVFNRSWRMMQPEEQDVFAKLSVFRGGFTREAAEQVTGANLRVLLALMNKSLLQREADSGRFTIHELLRQFAGLKLHRDKDHQKAYLAHCRYYARLVVTETDQALNMYPMDLPRNHAADKDNIRRAWDYAVRHGLAPELGGMARGMATISFAQGVLPTPMLESAITSLRQGIPETDPALLQLRLVELNTRTARDDPASIRRRFLNFLSSLPEDVDSLLHYWVLDCMAFLEIDDDMAQSFYWQEKAYVVAQQMDDKRFMKRIEALSLWFRLDSGFEAGLPLADIKEYREGTLLHKLQELLAFFEASLSQSFIVYSLLMSLCIYYLWIKECDQALKFGRRGLNIAKEWRDLFWIGFAGDRVADVYMQMGQPDQAVTLLLDIFEWHLAIGQVWQTLGYLYSKPIRFSQLFGGREKVVPILAMVYHHSETSPFYQSEIEKVRSQIINELGEKRFRVAWEMGQALDFETAVSRVRSELGAKVGDSEPAGRIPIG